MIIYQSAFIPGYSNQASNQPGYCCLVFAQTNTLDFVYTILL
jgi:hypothetical protein